MRCGGTPDHSTWTDTSFPVRIVSASLASLAVEVPRSVVHPVNPPLNGSGLPAIVPLDAMQRPPVLWLMWWKSLVTARHRVHSAPHPPRLASALITVNPPLDGAVAFCQHLFGRDAASASLRLDGSLLCVRVASAFLS